MLRTERLLLRPWTAGDLADATALWGDAQVMRFLNKQGALTTAEIAARLAREIAALEQHGIQYWRASSGDDFVGCCGLKLTHVDGELVTEMGFHLVPAHWNKGYASEAARAVIAHAFEVRGVRELYAGHHPENHASRRVLERLGFRQLSERYYEPTGLMHPWYVRSQP
jgi:[ribosomal protein S5]-alanine N-acetyltransferase